MAHTFEVKFIGNGDASPSSISPLIGVTREGEGLFEIVVPGSGPLKFLGGDAVVNDPAYRATVVGQTADRTFQVQVAQGDGGSAGGALTATKAADAAAATESTVTVDGVFAREARITAVTYTPDAALTADDTDFATLTILDSNDATVAAISTEITGGSGDWTEDVAVPIPVSAVGVDAGVSLRLEITKTGLGVIIPAGTLSITYENVSALTVSRTIGVRRAADALAADESEIYLDVAPRTGTITEVSFVPDAALTADNTNFATVALMNGATPVASQTTEITGSGNWVAGTPVPLTIDTDEDTLAEGEILSLAITKTLAGVAVPAGLLIVRVSQPIEGIASGSLSGDLWNDEQVFVQLFLGPQNL